ncbi:MAG: carbohydrate ABC transporter permease [Microbacteriaceae bacterium]|nr:MAG: carbohydrate ABC transporter permease [Microbacteriaceae bacterium]
MRLRTRLGRVGPYVGLGVFFVVFGVPVYWILLSSVLPPNEVLSSPPTLFTLSPTLETFERALQQLPAGDYLRNSLVFALSSAFASVILAFFAAYTFARLRFRGSGALMLFLLLTMALPQIATTIPLFQLYAKLGLVDTMGGLILLESSILIPMTVWLMVSFIKQIPVDLENASFMDGANFAQTIHLVVLPLMRPAFVTLFLLNFITAWNELFYPLVFSSTSASRTLTVGLVQITQVNSGASSRPWDLMSALAALMIIPIILLVTIMQRRIIAGLTAGATK